MVSKCVNPHCKDDFRYFRGGKLFRFHVAEIQEGRAVKRTEFYWLCQDCAPVYTLLLECDGTVLLSGLSGRPPELIPRPPAIAASAA